jgi:CheY-like chemotaxis protein
MDGIETTAVIRSMGGVFLNLPVIALTANAVSGMREMFLEKGFNDYLTKPIDIAKLNEIIRNWNPRNKQQKIFARSFPGIPAFEEKSADPGGANKTVARPSGASPSESAIQIPGIDAARGINMTGGTLAGYKKVLASFCRDARERLPVLQDVLRQSPGAADLGSFTTHVHALKSAAATIGAAELSQEAAELEAAGKAGDIGVIEKNTTGFYERLKETVERIDTALAEKTPGAGSGVRPGLNLSDAGVHRLFAALRTALEAKDMAAIDRLTGDLMDKGLDTETEEMLNTVSDLLLLANFKQAVTAIDTILNDGENQ